jgi:RPA family protein
MFAGRGCHVVSVMDPYGHILGFLDQYQDDKMINLENWKKEVFWH